MLVQVFRSTTAVLVLLFSNIGGYSGNVLEVLREKFFVIDSDFELAFNEGNKVEDAQ
jgi:hypothetical protein